MRQVYTTRADSFKGQVKVTRKGLKKMGEKANSNTLEWLSGQTLTEYRGLWIVAYNRAILAKAPTLEQALKKAKLAPGVVPFVCRVPESERLAL